MKKQVLIPGLLILFFCTGNLHAQMTVTHSNNAPFIGYVATYMTMDEPEIDPGPPGPNQTWNFAGFTGTYQDEVAFIDPTDTPFADEIIGTDINLSTIIEDEDVGGFGYLTVNTSQLLVNAMGMMEGEEPFFFAEWNPPLKVMEFPFGYGDTFESHGVMEFEMDDMTIIQKSWSTSEADAWGTITTPQGTFSNTLRIKTVEIDSTSIYFDGNLIISEGFESTDYIWFSPAHRLWVFEVSGEYDEFYIPFFLSYLTDETVGTTKIPEISLKIYPNPAQNEVFIEIPDQEGTFVVIIKDLAGRKLHSSEIHSGHSAIDVRQLSGGLYLLQIQHNNKAIGSKKLVIL